MRYLDKPIASMRAVHYLGFYDTPMANRSTYRTRQVFQHPYIALSDSRRIASLRRPSEQYPSES